jgi:hypothetical protein
MSDETNPIAPVPVTSPNFEATPQPDFIAPRNRSVSCWLNRLFACNPFYLVSAALLLFGMYRVSVDPSFLRTETAQLVFNFASLQFYELLLVFTAIALARRCVWYDATLLVVLENLFVLVPFILVSQAALIEQRTVWALCLFAAALAAARSGAAQRWISVLTLSPRLLAGGMAVLALNTAWPILYRTFHETKVGTKPTWGAAYEMNELSWLWLLPALCAVVNLLPRPREHGELLVQRRWFATGLLLLWIAGTGVHLYCLGYVYDFDLRRELLAPTLCVLAWTLHRRLMDFVPAPMAGLRTAALTLPLLASFCAAGVDGSSVFFTLTALNALGFAFVALVERDNHTARHLGMLTLAILVATIPRDWVTPMVGEFSREKFVGVASAAYLLLSAALSRSPKVAFAGALAAAFAGGMIRGQHADMLHWATQAGVVFMLLHSLRWRDGEHQGAATMRLLVAVVWLAHSFVWLRNGAAFLQPFSIAAAVLTIWWFRGFVFRNWTPVVVPVAAVMVATCTPVNFAFVKLQTTPAGVIAIVGSFLLFGLGTIAALTRHRWHRE